MSGLQIAGLTRRHGGRAVVDDVSLSVAAGSVTALVGPSGSGKSTLLRLVAGLEQPDSGAIRLDGHDLLPLPPERRGAVMMLQGAELFPHLSVLDNVAFGLRMRGVSLARRQAEALAMLERLSVADLAGRRPSTLSGGQAQRVALARALVVAPRVLLLDEPLSSLDPLLRPGLAADIVRRCRESGAATLFVTHDREEAVTVGDRIALIDGGGLVQEDIPPAMFERPANAKAAAFFGMAGLLEGTVRAGAAIIGGRTMAFAGVAAPGEAHFVIRPEAVILGPAERQDAPQALPGTVVASHYRGTHDRIDVAVAGTVLAVSRSPGGPSLAPGEAVAVILPADRLWRLPG